MRNKFKKHLLSEHRYMRRELTDAIQRLLSCLPQDLLHKEIFAGDHLYEIRLNKLTPDRLILFHETVFRLLIKEGAINRCRYEPDNPAVDAVRRKDVLDVIVATLPNDNLTLSVIERIGLLPNPRANCKLPTTISANYARKE